MNPEQVHITGIALRAMVILPPSPLLFSISINLLSSHHITSATFSAPLLNMVITIRAYYIGCSVTIQQLHHHNGYKYTYLCKDITTWWITSTIYAHIVTAETMNDLVVYEKIHKWPKRFRTVTKSTHDKQVRWRLQFACVILLGCHLIYCTTSPLKMLQYLPSVRRLICLHNLNALDRITQTFLS